MVRTKIFIALCFFITAYTFGGCSGNKMDRSLTIESETLLDSIPSGSGLAIHNDTVYIIGDDATGVYTVNPSNLSQTKIPVTGLAYNEYRYPKDTKHDFESAAFIEWENKKYLFAFGSGSKKTLRDSLLILNIDDHRDQRIVSLSEFYNELQSKTQTDPLHWNIEGVTVVGGNLILCNRGNNLIIMIRLKEFLDHVLDSNATFPQMVSHRVKLPMIESKEARFSGLCSFSDSLILFCASVEDTPDWIQDGPVMGSYIGMYSLNQNQIVASYLLKDKEGRVLKEKIESIDILNRDQNTINLLAIADNDNGSSKIFRLRLQMGSNR